MPQKLISDFLVLLATIDPIGTLVLFAALLRGQTVSERRLAAKKSVIYAFFILLGSLMIGQAILSGLGIKLASFKIAGGIILFILGLKMVLGTLSELVSGSPEDGHDIAVFPLAIPSMANPGAIVAVILLTDNAQFHFSEQAMTAGIMVLVLLITYLLMRFSDIILKVIGHNGASIMERMMGMILCAMSVELIMSSLGISFWVEQ